MKVKKLLSLMLALLLVVAMFAGCAPKDDTPSAPATTPGTSTNTPSDSQGGEEVKEDSPYNFAAGNFEKITALCAEAHAAVVG